MRRGAPLSGILLSAVALLAACDRPASSNERGAVRDQPIWRPGYVVDSALPASELLRRFRVGLDSPAALDGPPRRDELVRRFLEGVRRGDRAAVERLGVTKAEFAYLIFPGSKISKPPYNQPPDIEWLLLSSASDAGLARLLKRAGQIEFRRYTCDQPPVVDGRARYWPGCTVRVVADGAERPLRLFGAIVEVGGRFKFRDFGNGF